MKVFSKRNLPRLGVGLGYRSAIHESILRSLDAIDWLEIVADQFIPLNDVTRSRLTDFRNSGPCVSHSLELSLGSITPPPGDYARSVVAVADCLEAPWFSDHLAFNRLVAVNTGAFLPPFRDRSSVFRIAERIRGLQTAANRPFLAENVAGVIDPGGELDEVDFLNAVAEQADCGILLDIANLFGRCLSLGWGVEDYLERINLDRVIQVHIAGGRWHDGHLRDTHDQPVSGDVWSLLAHVADRTSINAVLIERDANFPNDFGTLLAELDRAREILAYPRGYLRALRSTPIAVPIPHLNMVSQQQFEMTVERAVLTAGSDSDRHCPPDVPLRSDQWRELRRFGTEVLHKRGQLVAAVFPATLRLLAGPKGDPGALINKFAVQHPRMRAFEDDIGFRIAEIDRFSHFAAATADAQQLPPEMRAVLAYEAALASASAAEQLQGLPTDCPTGTCRLTHGRLHLCATASVAWATAAHLISAEVNVPAIRAAILAGYSTELEEFRRVCEQHREPTELMVAPSGRGQPRIFRLGRRESAVLRSVVGTNRVGRNLPPAGSLDNFSICVLGAASQAHALVITHSVNNGGQE